VVDGVEHARRTRADEQHGAREGEAAQGTETAGGHHEPHAGRTVPGTT